MRFWYGGNFLITIGTWCCFPGAGIQNGLFAVLEQTSRFQQRISGENIGNFWRRLGVRAEDVDLVEKGKGAGAKSCTGLCSLCSGCTSTWKNFFARRDGGLLRFTASATLRSIFFPRLFRGLQLRKRLRPHLNLLYFFCSGRPIFKDVIGKPLSLHLSFKKW